MKGGLPLGGMPLQNPNEQPISRDELLNRRLVEFDVEIVRGIQTALVCVGDLVRSCTDVDVFGNMPEREKILNEAKALYSTVAKKQLRMVRKIDKGLSKLEALAGKEDPLFGAEPGKTTKV